MELQDCAAGCGVCVHFLAAAAHCGGYRWDCGLCLVYHEGVAAGGGKGVVVVWLGGHVCALDVVSPPGGASRASLGGTLQNMTGLLDAQSSYQCCTTQTALGLIAMDDN